MEQQHARRPKMLSNITPESCAAPLAGVAREDEAAFGNLLRDPLIRLVMKSDGVTEEAMIALMTQLRRSLAERQSRTRSMQSVKPGLEAALQPEMV